MSQLTICLIIFAVTIIGYCSGAYSLATIAITSLMAFTLTGCLSAFMTPMATSGVGYIMGSGGYDQKSMIRQSLPLALICCVVSVGWIMTVFPL